MESDDEAFFAKFMAASQETIEKKLREKFMEFSRAGLQPTPADIKTWLVEIVAEADVRLDQPIEVSRHIKEHIEEVLASKHRPDSYACHEALHMSAFFASAVESELVEHRAVMSNPEWLQLATNAVETLSALYQKIGESRLWNAGERTEE